MATSTPQAQGDWVDDLLKASSYAKPGPYTTRLNPDEESRFQQWTKSSKIPWQDSPTADYDMRGYWRAQQSGNPQAKQDAATGHFPDTWKTPYHKTFSNESMYANDAAPHWEGDKLVPSSKSSDWVDDLLKTPSPSSTMGSPIQDSSTISAREPSFWERARAAVTSGAPSGSWLGEKSPVTRFDRSPADVQLIRPEEAMTPVERHAHPIATAVAETAGQLTTPENTLLATGIPGGPIGRIAGGVFGGQMLSSIPETLDAAKKAEEAGDHNESVRLKTHAWLSGGLGALGLTHAIRGEGAVPAAKEARIGENRAASPETGREPSQTPTGPPAEPAQPSRPQGEPLTWPPEESSIQNFRPEIDRSKPQGEPVTWPAQRLLPGGSRFDLPERLEPPQAPHPETEQPKSDLSDVDRSKVPGGKFVDPKSLAIDWDSHPFMLKDDIVKAKERAAKGEELSAIVHTDPATGKMEVVDGHGAIGAALELNRPIRVIEATNVQGEEAIGARVASHFAAQDKPEVTANFDDPKDRPVVGQDVPTLRRIHEDLQEGRPATFGEPAVPPVSTAPGAAGAADWVDAMLKSAGSEASRGTVEPRPAETAPAVNASAESAASLEAQRRAEAEQSAGVKRFVTDTRTGRERPLIGPDAVDYKVRPTEISFKRDTAGRVEVVDRGEKAMEKVGQKPAEVVKAEPLVKIPVAASPEERVSFHNRLDSERGFVTLQSLSDLRNLPGAFWRKFISEPSLKKMGQGPTHDAVRERDPQLATLQTLRDNVPRDAYGQAKHNVKKILGDAPREQERLASLISDAKSRENLRRNHPAEYQSAMTDPIVQGIVNRYRPLEHELTNERQAMGYPVLDEDYARRVYADHIAEPKSTQPYANVPQLSDLNQKSRIADPEYHYEHGLHEFGPAYGTKFVSQKMVAVDHQIINRLEETGTVLSRGDTRPDSIIYQGETYYSKEQARLLGSDKVYGEFDPTKLLKFKTADSVILLPREVVDDLSAERNPYRPGKFKQFLQKGVLGLSFGFPHAFANIPRRIEISNEGGYLNPKGLKDNFRVFFSKELRDRAKSGRDDPTIRGLASVGSARLDEEYTGFGSKWIGLKWGHDLLFNPHSWGGFGGVDLKARMLKTDQLINQHPEMPWDQIGHEIDGLFGKYSQENWTRTQKGVAHVAWFPGWLFSSIKTGLEHPMRATVGASVLIYSLNQALHKAGFSRKEDADDISRIHVGNYAFSPTLFSEPFAKTIMQAPLQATQALIRNASSREAADAFMTSAVGSPGRLSSHLLPYYSLPIELAANRQFLGNEREIFKPGSFDRPGKTGVLSEGTEAILEHAGVRVIPQIGRLFPEREKVLDLPSFLGSQVGLPMGKEDEEYRLGRNLGTTSRATTLIRDMAKSSPDEVRKTLEKDPQTRVALQFHSSFEQIERGIHKIDEEKDRLKAAGRDTQKLDQAREYLLKTADELNDKFNARLAQAKK